MKKSKIRIIVISILAIALLTGSALVAKSLIPEKATESSLNEATVVMGSQTGVVTLAQIPSQQTLDSINLSEVVVVKKTEVKGTETNTDKTTPSPAAVVKTTTPTSVISPTVKINNTTITTKSGRKVTKVGERDGYNIVSAKIKSGEHWLKVQREISPELNAFKLIALGQKINKDNRINPIYPGETILFLSKITATTPANPPAKVVEDIKVIPTKEEPKTSTSESINVVTAIDDTIDKGVQDAISLDYIYDLSADNSYVYNNQNATLYQIRVKDNKLTAAVLMTLPGKVRINEFIVNGDTLYFTTLQNKDIYYFSNNILKKIKIQSYVECWDVSEDNVYYTAADTLCRINTKTGKVISVYLGDESTDIYIEGTNLYVANNFGSNALKSVIHKLDTNLVSHGWAEVNFATNTEIAYVKDGQMLLEQNIENEATKFAYITEDLALSYESMQEVLMKNVKVSNKMIYSIEKGVLYLFNMQGEELLKMAVSASDICVL